MNIPIKIRPAITLLAGALTGAACVLGAQQITSQRTPQFENDEVKVWKSVVLPHQPLALHRHDHPRVAVVLAGGTMNFIDSGGTREVAAWETGKAYWLNAMPPGAMHADVNAGDKPIEVMIVELKKAN